MSNDFIVVIPARYGAGRLPGKPLSDIGGQPLLQHVYLAASRSAAQAVYIATDDARVEAVARDLTDKVLPTSPTRRNGTERIAEAVGELRLPAARIVVNVQGDEFNLPPALIEQVAAILADCAPAVMTSLYTPIKSGAQLRDPNNVKVALDHQGNALWFSRSPIPWQGRDASADTRAWRHVGVYAYTCGFLETYARLPVCAPEQSEGLEQLRALYYGHRIRMGRAVVEPGLAINTPADLATATRWCRQPRAAPTSG